MTQKGESYTKVGIDLQLWAKDYMRLNNLKLQRELAERIFTENGDMIHRGRINDLLKGRMNSMKMLQLIVSNIYGGDYLAMSQYATDDDGTKVLEYMAFRKTLDEVQRKVSMDVHSAFREAIRKKEYNKIKEAIKLLKS